MMRNHRSKQIAVVHCGDGNGFVSRSTDNQHQYYTTLFSFLLLGIIFLTERRQLRADVYFLLLWILDAPYVPSSLLSLTASRTSVTRCSIESIKARILYFSSSPFYFLRMAGGGWCGSVSVFPSSPSAAHTAAHSTPSYQVGNLIAAVFSPSPVTPHSLLSFMAAVF